jgi:hypothetical protein
VFHFPMAKVAPLLLRKTSWLTSVDAVLLYGFSMTFARLHQGASSPQLLQPSR